MLFVRQGESYLWLAVLKWVKLVAREKKKEVVKQNFFNAIIQAQNNVKL